VAPRPDARRDAPGRSRRRDTPGIALERPPPLDDDPTDLDADDGVVATPGTARSTTAGRTSEAPPPSPSPAADPKAKKPPRGRRLVHAGKHIVVEPALTHVE
jgi:hypothetical protein